MPTLSDGADLTRWQAKGPTKPGKESRRRAIALRIVIAVVAATSGHVFVLAFLLALVTSEATGEEGIVFEQAMATFVFGVTAAMFLAALVVLVSAVGAVIVSTRWSSSFSRPSRHTCILPSL